jgi:DNA-binding MarR family transcriptional regulator
MKPLFGLLALALMLSPAYAEHTAYFSENSSAMLYSALNLAYQGNYGNYTVEVGVFPLPSYVRVIGNDASQMALANEVGYLVRENGLATSCNAKELLNFSGNDAYCNDSGEWIACSDGLCLKREAAQASGAFPAPEMPQDSKAPLQQPLTDVLGMGSSVQKTSSMPEQPPSAAPQPGGIGTEQMLQMLGAFIAIIIASYLLLHNGTHQQPVDAAAERLLENPTRAGIMEELSSADKIPTDLSAKLGKSKASVVEHLAALSEAGLVERVSTPGKKFVFYKLTQKGRQVLLRKAG